MALKTVDINIIVPKEATNLITNPSFHTDTTGYAASGTGVTIARVTTQSRRGVASCEVTTAANVNSAIVYTITLALGTSYSFSADVLDVNGQSFSLFVQDHAYATITSTSWTGTGYWKRRNITFTSDAGDTTHYLVVQRNSVNSTTKYYTDGWQCETGAVSTYLDGDMVGYVNGETAYRWNGTRHASTSWRSGQTRSGGNYVKLSTYARILGIVGLGMAGVSNIAVPSQFGGAFYQNTVPSERGFSVVVNFNAAGDYSTIQKNKEAITTCVKPDKTIYRQPLLLQYDELDANSLEIAETLELPCLYEGGLEMAGDGDSYNEKLSLNFRMFQPLIQQQGEHGTALGFQTTVTDTDYVAKRDTSGIWSSLAHGVDGVVSALVNGTDGSIYAGGTFVNAGNAADADLAVNYIAKWSGTAWSALGTTGVAGGTPAVYALAVGPDGSLYVGGNFTSAGGVANTAYIAKWNGSVWTPLGQGTDGEVNSLAFDNSGNLYVGGGFSHVHATGGAGVADTVRIAKWDGTTWTALGTGITTASSYVYALAVAADNSVYAGGDFTTANGVTVANIAKWNGTTFTTLGGGMAGATPVVRALSIGSDGMVYAGGRFLTAGGVTVNGIAAWNGSVWSALGVGVGTPATDAVWALKSTPGILYAGGFFSKMGGVSLPDKMAAWNGSSWFPLDIDFAGTSYIYSIMFDVSGKLFIGNATPGSSVSATVTVPSVGSATAYPKLIFTGPGVLSHMRNYTTGKAIYFNLTLLAGEVATLNLNPTSVSFTSTFRGNIMSTILPGSDLNWYLLPGSNNVSAYYSSGTTAASGINMTWKDQYWSIDGAVR